MRIGVDTRRCLLRVSVGKGGIHAFSSPHIVPAESSEP